MCELYDNSRMTMCQLVRVEKIHVSYRFNRCHPPLVMPLKFQWRQIELETFPSCTSRMYGSQAQVTTPPLGLVVQSKAKRNFKVLKLLGDITST